MAPTILYAALVPFALAQSSVLTVMYTGYQTDTMIASLVGADSSKTTLAVGCHDTVSDCDGPLRQTMVVGSSTLSINGFDPNTDFTYTQDCVLSPQSAVCKESAGGSEANFPGSSTTTYEPSELGAVVFTVTAGDVGKLSAQTTGSASASMATSTGAAQTGSKSESMASVTKSQGMASASASRAASGSASAAPTATGAATSRAVALGSALFAVAAGLIGGQMF